jgi:hypothetical protein
VGLGVDNYLCAEDFQAQIVNNQLVVVLQGWIVAIDRGSPASHEPSPALGDAAWTDLRAAARTSQTAFAAEASSAWGSWWSARTSTQQTLIWRAVEATRARP